MQQAEAECEELNAENESLRQEVFTINQMLVELRGTPEIRESIAMQYANDRKVASEGKKRLESIALELEKWKIDYRSLEIDFSEYKKKIDGEKQTILQLAKDECDSLTQKIESKDEELEKLHQELSTLSKKIDRMKSKQHQMIDEYQKMEEEVHSIETAKKTLSVELDSRNQKIQELEQELQENPSVETVEAMKSRLSELHQKNKESETLLEAIRAETALDLAEARAANKQLRGELKAERKEKEKQSRAADRLQAEVDSLKKQLIEVEESANVTKNRTKDELTDRILALESEKMQLKQAFEELQDEVDISRRSMMGNQPSFMDELRAMDRASIRFSRVSLLPQSHVQTESLRAQLVSGQNRLKKSSF